MSAALPIFVTTDTNSDFKQFTAAFETSLNPSSLTDWKSPLEGPSAILLKELTLEIQQFVRTCVSISVKISAMQSTTELSDLPRIKQNFVPSLSTYRKHFLLVMFSVQRL